MSYKTYLEESKNVVINYDTFYLLRNIQEKLYTLLGKIDFNGSEPSGLPYSDVRYIRYGIPTGKKTKLTLTKEKSGRLYRMKYEYTLEDK